MLVRHFFAKERRLLYCVAIPLFRCEGVWTIKLAIIKVIVYYFCYTRLVDRHIIMLWTEAPSALKLELHVR
jgi:hypothetical protein